MSNLKILDPDRSPSAVLRQLADEIDESDNDCIGIAVAAVWLTTTSHMTTTSEYAGEIAPIRGAVGGLALHLDRLLLGEP